MIPRYLYLSTIGIPFILSLSIIFLFVFLLFHSIIPDFSAFICMLFSFVHYIIMSIAYSNLFCPIPLIARSSANAKSSKPLDSNSSSKSLNMTRNSVGERIPPYITPLPTLIRRLLTVIYVCAYSHYMVLTSFPSVLIFFNLFINIL